MEKRRPVQSDVARLAGVHRATVSLVLSNHPSISPETKKRVLRCAKKLGYSPDPMLSALAVYRSRHRPKPYQGTLAWLANDSMEGYSWRGVKNSADYYKGALGRAKAHGYNLEVFDLHEFAASPERLASILRARSINGILLPPQMRARVEIDFPWEHFATVTFGFSLVRPKLHAVTSAQFRATVQTMRQLKQLGYRRIGFHFSTDHDDKTDHNYLAGYLVETHAAGDEVILPPPPSSDWRGQFLRWFEQHRLDAIISGHVDILDFLKECGLSAPRDLGVATPLVLDKESPLAGVYEDSFHIGEVATNYLVSMLHCGERGIPERPQRLLVEGSWHPGATLRPAKEAKPPRRAAPAIA